ncbi:Gfo/Idh/MocA family oxidoreductase [Olivibacter sp. SDN3]|uniref:Gfo/Idh/MocA family protein n=1 Tax=Olivibacter sp. SDN3 TaxID=2764720 RepID=UPI0016512A31|nr:Gfo/Idh/MocA family oxidoreductase [Olivibacter sp. SDN3]QNL49454.1 Gfo/Idh/MocA family oxidoreductase [Olivibacter sp. SDN3]
MIRSFAKKKFYLLHQLVLLCMMSLTTTKTFGNDLLKVVVVGLSHDHVHLILNQHKNKEVIILGIAENNNELITRFKKAYNLPDTLFYDNLKGMLNAVKPDIALAYNAIADHISVVETCAPLKIDVMVEKPLAINTTQAKRIADLAEKHGIRVLTNYETTWYGSNQTIKQLVDSGFIGQVKKVLVRDGHEGPQEIGCSKEFLAWLTDPEKNGGGAIMDFGCYGANLLTWLMEGERPVAVTATKRQLKPAVYPNVDDDATIILEYANVTAVIQASWDWPYSIKDMQVFGEKKSLHAVDDKKLILYESPKNQKNIDLKEDYYKDNLVYLKEVLEGNNNTENDLSSLSNNLLVVEILEKAKESAQKGERILF